MQPINISEKSWAVRFMREFGSNVYTIPDTCSFARELFYAILRFITMLCVVCILLLAIGSPFGWIIGSIIGAFDTGVILNIFSFDYSSDHWSSILLIAGQVFTCTLLLPTLVFVIVVKLYLVFTIVVNMFNRLYNWFNRRRGTVKDHLNTNPPKKQIIGELYNSWKNKVCKPINID